MSDFFTSFKRRFSSGDLQGENADRRDQPSAAVGGGVVGPSNTGVGSSAINSAKPGAIRTGTGVGSMNYGSNASSGVGASNISGGGMTSLMSSFTSSISSGQSVASSFFDNMSSGITLQQQAQDHHSAASSTSGYGSQQPVKQRGPFPSAPTSPSKSSSTSGFSVTANSMSGITGQISSTITRGIFASTSKSSYNKDRCVTLLVIDDPNTDWSKYFRGRKIFGDYDIRIEQGQFEDLHLAAYTTHGVLINLQVDRSGTKLARSFCPDLVLVRQHVRDAGSDWRSLIIGLMYGGVVCINNATALFNFLERPWVFCHLLQIQQKTGKDNFPLIDQAYYPNYKEMAGAFVKELKPEHVASNFPMVIKIGHAHAGLGKIRVEKPQDFQDVASVAAMCNTYSTTEPLIDAKYDVHIQKIGNSYKAFIRKSISGTWKANTGSAMLEVLPMNERFRMWIDEVAALFGGLDICAVEAVQAKDGFIHIVEVNGSDLTLMGESQEEDRRLIAEIVINKLQNHCKPAVINKTESLTGLQRFSNSGSQIQQQQQSSQMSPSTTITSSVHSSSVPPTPQRGITTSTSGLGNASDLNQSISSGQAPTQIDRQASSVNQRTGISSSHPQAMPQQSSYSSMTSGPNQTAPPGRPNMPPPRQASLNRLGGEQEGEDTMKNLRKTFAGIFGDM